MAKETKNMVKLGVFVTASVLVFVAGIYYLGNSKNIFGKTFSIHSDFKNVNGLQLGGSVRFSGINVGSVQEINVLNDSTLRVAMRIQEGMRPYIKKDAIASIGTDGLVGSTLVNINPGKSQLPSVENHDIIPSFNQIEADKVIQTLGRTSEHIASLSLNLLEVTEKLNNGEGMLGTLLNDPTMVNEIQQSIRHINNTSKNLANLTTDINRSLSDAKDGKGLLGYLMTDTTLMPQIQNTAKRVDIVVKDMDAQIKPIFSEVNQSVEEINTLTKEMQQVVKNINDGKGTVGSFLNDEATEQQVQGILENVNESTIKLNENLEAMRSNWLFRKYFRKKRKTEKKKEKATKENLSKNKGG